MLKIAPLLSLWRRFDGDRYNAVAWARLNRDAEAERHILDRQAAAFAVLAERIGRLYENGERGGEAEKFAHVSICLALAKAQLQHHSGDFESERETLRSALPLSVHVRQAIGASYDVGTATFFDMAFTPREEEPEALYSGVGEELDDLTEGIIAPVEEPAPPAPTDP